MADRSVTTNGRFTPRMSREGTLCFYWKLCRRHAELEKGGKSVCRRCGQRLRGRAYPLRPPSRQPLYPNARACAEALDMVETDHKRMNRSDRWDL